MSSKAVRFGTPRNVGGCAETARGIGPRAKAQNGKSLTTVCAEFPGYPAQSCLRPGATGRLMELKKFRARTGLYPCVRAKRAWREALAKSGCQLLTGRVCVGGSDGIAVMAPDKRKETLGVWRIAALGRSNSPGQRFSLAGLGYENGQMLFMGEMREAAGRIYAIVSRFGRAQIQWTISLPGAARRHQACFTAFMLSDAQEFRHGQHPRPT